VCLPRSLQAAPVAVALKGLRAGEEAVFNGQTVRVLEVR